MNKFSIWSADTNRDIQQAREDGAIYPVLLPDNVSAESVTRILETVGDCYRGDKKTFQFEWERVPDQYAMITYTRSSVPLNHSSEPVVKAYVGVYPLFNNKTSHDLKELDFVQFIRDAVGVSDIRPVNACGRTTFHYYNNMDQECIIEITRTKTINSALAEQLIIVNAD